MKNRNFDNIPQEKFRFVQMDTHLHDTKLETKARSYFADALLRFSKNKSSVIAAWILLFLLVFSLLSPLVSGYTLDQKDNIYINESRHSGRCNHLLQPERDRYELLARHR